MLRLLMVFGVVALTACGPASHGGKVPIGLESPEESPGDAVTNSQTPGQSPGIEPRRTK